MEVALSTATYTANSPIAGISPGKRLLIFMFSFAANNGCCEKRFGCERGNGAFPGLASKQMQ